MPGTRSPQPLTSCPEVVALVADETRWWVGPHELAVLHADCDEAVWRPLRGRSRGRQHAVAVEVVDLLQLGQDVGPRRLGAGGRQRLHEEAGRLPAEGGEDVGLATDLLQPLVEE